MRERRGRFRVVREAGEVVRVCPGCLKPLTWYEYLSPRKKADPNGPQSTDEQARCSVHGPVDWWRIMRVDPGVRGGGLVLGFATHLRGGRLYQKRVPAEDVIEHAARPLIGLHAHRGRHGKNSVQKMTREQYRKLRNRFRGYVVEDVRQGRLF